MLQNMFLYRILLRKLWSDRLLLLLGSTKLWTRSRNEYPLVSLSWRRWCNTCRVLFLIAEKNASSALSHNNENISKLDGQKPVFLDRLRNPSNPSKIIWNKPDSNNQVNWYENDWGCTVGWVHTSLNAMLNESHVESWMSMHYNMQYKSPERLKNKSHSNTLYIVHI